MEKENWKKLERYPEHEISDLGRIKRSDGHIYAINRNGDNVAVSIIYLDYKSRKTVMIAREVLIAFKKAIKPKIEYIDGNKMNCKLSNLNFTEFKLVTKIEKNKAISYTCLDCKCYPCIHGRTSEYVQPIHYAKSGCIDFKLKK